MERGSYVVVGYMRGHGKLTTGGIFHFCVSVGHTKVLTMFCRCVGQLISVLFAGTHSTSRQLSTKQIHLRPMITDCPLLLEIVVTFFILIVSNGG